MRIGDWSSDVCSSDLLGVAGALEDLGDAAAELLQLLHGIAGDDGAGGGAADDQHLVRQGVHDGAEVSPGDEEAPEHHDENDDHADRWKHNSIPALHAGTIRDSRSDVINGEIGSASCRERECQYG